MRKVYLRQWRSLEQTQTWTKYTKGSQVANLKMIEFILYQRYMNKCLLLPPKMWNIHILALHPKKLLPNYGSYYFPDRWRPTCSACSILIPTNNNLIPMIHSIFGRKLMSLYFLLSSSTFNPAPKYLWTSLKYVLLLYYALP